MDSWTQNQQPGMYHLTTFTKIYWKTGLRTRKITFWKECYNIFLTSQLITKSGDATKNINLKNFMAPFYGWGSTASRLQSLRGGSLLFTIQFPEIPDTQYSAAVVNITIKSLMTETNLMMTPLVRNQTIMNERKSNYRERVYVKQH